MDEHQPAPWERLPDELPRAHLAFRHFRDLGPLRRLDSITSQLGVHLKTVQRWAVRWDWWTRAEAWDTECYRLEDAERLEAIRRMHANHQRAGRAAMVKALQALDAMPPSHVPAGAAARLLELGAKLERATLTVSVADLQGIDEPDEDEGEDPWARIAAELDSA